MAVHQLTNVLVTVTLVEMMAATGLGVTFDDLAQGARASPTSLADGSPVG
jgi:hypothetical protein